VEQKNTLEQQKYSKNHDLKAMVIHSKPYIQRKKNHTNLKPLFFFFPMWMQNFTLGFNSLYHFIIMAFLFRYFRSNGFVFLYISVLHAMQNDHLLHQIPNTFKPLPFLKKKFKWFLIFWCAISTETHECVYV